jgi:hypothetical protein
LEQEQQYGKSLVGRFALKRNVCWELAGLRHEAVGSTETACASASWAVRHGISVCAWVGDSVAGQDNEGKASLVLRNDLHKEKGRMEREMRYEFLVYF